MRPIIAKLYLLCLALLLPVSEAGAVDKRVALVIGNSAYATAPLRNPQNDARDMANKLRSLGFEVVVRENLQIREIGSALRDFRSRLTPGAEALFFYAGHGLQVKGVNYLPAVDADIRTEEDLPYQSLNANQVLEIMEDAGTRLNLVFLDACRNNPYSRRFRSADNGLAKLNAPSGTLISFATRPGSVAADGDGRNGLFTSHLLREMEVPNVPIESVLKRVVTGVKTASKGQQEPWLEGSIEGEFYFRITAPANTAVSVVPPSLQLKQPGGGVIVVPATSDEDALWLAVERGNTLQDYNVYLDQYSKGRYEPLAKARIEKLEQDNKRVARERERASDAWGKAEEKHTEDAYREYLNNFPHGAHAQLASARLRHLREPQVLASAAPSVTMAAPAIGSAPMGLSEEAKLWSEAREAANSGDDKPLLGYLKRYPSGAYAREAQALNADLQVIKSARVGKRFKDCPGCPEMVIIGPGSFVMGTPRKGNPYSTSEEAPERLVTVSRPFALGRFEVTTEQWDACVAARGCAHRTEDKGWGRGNRPVTDVSWEDAQQYVSWLKKITGQEYRLPSEAEWEYAARAGSKTSRPWGEALGKNLANCNGCGSTFDDEKTAPVGSFPANKFGLHDMLGNVWEWTNDCYVKNYEGAPSDGRARSDGKCSQRMLRGGSYEEKDKLVRSAARRDDDTDEREVGYGFRVLRQMSGSTAELAAR